MEVGSQRPSRRSDGTLGERRRQLPWPEDKRFRILSIDGGGIRVLNVSRHSNKLRPGHLHGNHFRIEDYVSQAAIAVVLKAKRLQAVKLAAVSQSLPEVIAVLGIVETILKAIVNC